jgi:hypothetical protein
MPGCNAHGRGTARMAGSPNCLIFAASLALYMANLGSHPRKPSSQSYAPVIEAYCLLSNGPQFVHVEMFNSEGKFVSLSAIPVIVEGVRYWAQRCDKTQKRLQRTSDAHLRMRKSTSLGYVFRWLVQAISRGLKLAPVKRTTFHSFQCCYSNS